MGITHTSDNHQPLKLVYSKGRCPGNPTPSSNMSVNIHENPVSAAFLSKREEKRGRGRRRGRGRGHGHQNKVLCRRHQYSKGAQSMGKTGTRNGEGVSPEGSKEDIYSRSLSSGSELPAYFKQTSTFIACTCLQPKGMLHRKKIFVCISFIHLEMWYLLPLKCTRKLYMLLRSGYHWSVLAQSIFFLLFEIQVLCLLFFSQTIPV